MAKKTVSFIAAAILRTKAAFDAAKVGLVERKIDLAIDTKINQIDTDLLNIQMNRDNLLVAVAKGDESKLGALVGNFVTEKETLLAKEALAAIKDKLLSKVEVDSDELRTSAAGLVADALDKV